MEGEVAVEQAGEPRVPAIPAPNLALERTAHSVGFWWAVALVPVGRRLVLALGIHPLQR
jgi:hypothetical protein